MTIRINNRDTDLQSTALAARFRHKLVLRTVNKRFEAARRIVDRPLEVAFPGISGVCATIRSSVPSPAALGNLALHELVILSTICMYSKPARLFEFGTYDGLTTLHMAMNSPAEAQVFTIDLDQNDPLRFKETDDTFYTQGVVVGQIFHEHAEKSKIEQIFGNTLDFDSTMLFGLVDFIFVDAGHAYNLVKSDSCKALEMVRPGGIILWHDYASGHEGVYSYLNELSKNIEMFRLPGTTLVCHMAPR